MSEMQKQHWYTLGPVAKAVNSLAVWALDREFLYLIELCL